MFATKNLQLKNKTNSDNKIEEVLTFNDNEKKIHFLSVRNIPDCMTAYELYQILKFELKLEVIAVKIEAKKDASQPKQQFEVESKLALFLAQSPTNVLQIEPKYNQAAPILNLLQNQSKMSSVANLSFNPNSTPGYELKKVASQLSNDESSTKILKEKCEDIDQFLLRLHVKYKKNKQSSDAHRFPEFKDVIPGLAEPTKLSNLLDYLDSRSLIRMTTEKKKTAHVRVIGTKQQCNFNNHEYRYKGTHPIYIHYKHPKDKIDEFVFQRYKKTSESHKYLRLSNLELGVLDPLNKTDFLSYWDFHILGEKERNNCLIFALNDGKLSKKMFAVYEIPSLDKMVKIEFSCKCFEKIICERNDTKTNLYFEMLYPCRFYLNSCSDNQCFGHAYSEQWERITNFAIDENEDFLFKCYLSQATVVKVTFNDKSDDLEELIACLKGYFNENFVETIYVGKHDIESRKPEMTYAALDKAPTNFEIKYALLSCITQRKINLYEIDTEYLLELCTKMDQAVVEKTLKDIASKSRRLRAEEKSLMKNNFRQYFKELYEENLSSRRLWEKHTHSDHMTKTKRVTITPTVIIFHIQEAELSNCILKRHRTIAEDYFMRVTLSDELGEPTKNLRYISQRVFLPYVKEINILSRKFKFLAFSPSQLRSNSYWMFSEDNTEKLTVNDIHREIGNLERIRNPAKYAARLGQLFSSSYSVLNLKDPKIQLKEIPDITIKRGDKEYNFSDGVGKISMNLLRDIRLKMKVMNDISVIQIRCGGLKGILVGDPTLPDNTILYRPSMKKFDKSSYMETLELLDYNKFRYGYLNRQVIILLLTLGLDPAILSELQRENFKDLSKVSVGDSNLFSYINNEHHFSPTRDLLKECIQIGVDIVKEPFVKGVLDTIKIRSYVNLKEKCNILVKESARVIGVLDEYGILEPGEVFICISESNGTKNDKKIIDTEEVLVTKNPCLHPGDIRVLKPRDDKDVRKAFGHLLNCIVFPQKGERPHTSEISGSDLDGDLYFVCWKKELIPPQKNVEPMEYDTIKPKEQEKKVEMTQVVDFLIEYISNDILGRIDNSHLALADVSEDLANSKECIALAELHGIAVDFAKTGVCPSTENIKFARYWPDYMEKSDEFCFESKTVLGKLYREVRDHISTSGIQKILEDAKTHLYQNIAIDDDFIYDGYQRYLKGAFDVLPEYYNSIEKIMDLHGIQSEHEIFSGNFLKFMVKGLKKKYNLEKLQEQMIIHIQELKDKFSTIFLEDFKGSDGEYYIYNEKDEFLPEVLSKASAWYIASYYNPDSCKNSEIIDFVNKNLAEEYNRVVKKMKKLERQLIGLPWIVLQHQILEIKKSKKK